VFASSVLWFFGIHGSDTLEGVMETYFTPQLSANQAAVATGGVPTQIVTKEFFDCFVLMGGCGATICLLIAILLFSRNRARRGLGYAAAFPMIFNINEMMVFGLPIIFNPIMLIPFLVVPLACYTIAYLAISAGLVPMITSEAAWTTPIILGGYHATGSVAGSILQLVNVVVGVLVYLPFVRMLDRQTVVNAMHNYDSFMDFFKDNEQELAVGSLLERGDVYADFAKDLCAELRDGLKKGVVLYYQPQYHYDGRCIRGVVTNQNCREIIASITQLADSLGLTVLAEFVEDEAQRELLHSIGCDCYQGYLYSPAVSSDVGEG
jgi:hypothetical protein